MDDWLEKDYANTVSRLNKENQQLKQTIQAIKDYLKEEMARQESNWHTDDHSGTIKNILEQVEWLTKFPNEHTFENIVLGIPYKGYTIIYYNYVAQQTQSYKIAAPNQFRAVREFYRQKGRNMRGSIELVEEG